MRPEYCKEGFESGEYPRTTIECEKSDIIVAADGDTLLGFIHVKEAQTPPYDAVVQHRYAEVIEFVVTAQHRKQGIGTMLMDAAKQWSKDRTLDHIKLSVLANSADEVRFYKSKDFATIAHDMRCPL